jgi:hypothetical protein
VSRPRNCWSSSSHTLMTNAALGMSSMVTVHSRA